VGGLLEGKKIAGMAEAFHRSMTPHFYAGPLNLAAAVQLGVCSPNFLIQECLEKMDGFHSEVLKKPFVWEDGYLIPSKEPGLGYEFDEKLLEQYVVDTIS
jgi:L-alanine-DL-glutamate epimerase-like enolase superfamily enzyme